MPDDILRQTMPLRGDPQSSFNLGSGFKDLETTTSGKFAIDIDGQEVAYFRKVSGFSIETAVDTIKEGGENRFTYLLPSRTSIGKITLEQGVMPNDFMWKWYAEIFEQAVMKPRNIHIHAHSNIHSEANFHPGKRFSESLIKWTLMDALPVKWEGLVFDVQSSQRDERLFQKLTFVFLRFMRMTK